MLGTFVTLVASAATLAFAQDTDVNTVMAAFNSAHIVPDVLPSFMPVLPLAVAFPQTDGSMIEITAGMQLTIAQTAMEPTFALVSDNTAIQGKPYLIAMVDPDAPTPQNTSFAQVRHFLGADFVSDAEVNGEWPMTNRSAPLSAYMGPLPPGGTHRYVILCYLQAAAGDITAPPGFNASNVLNFNITQFVGNFSSDLTLIAGTYFLVAPDGAANATTSTDGGTPTSTAMTTGAAVASSRPALSSLAFIGVVGLSAFVLML